MHAIAVNFAQSLRAKLAELLHTYQRDCQQAPLYLYVTSWLHNCACRALLDYHLLPDQSCIYVFMDMHGRGTAHALLTQNCLVSLGGHCLQAYVGKTIRGHLAALQLVHLVKDLLW